MAPPIPITRAEYEARFGAGSASTPAPTSAPIPISRAEYAAKFGETAEAPRTWGDTFGDLGRSFAKGAGEMAHLGQYVAMPMGGMQRDIGNVLADALGIERLPESAYPGAVVSDAMETARLEHVGNPEYKGSTQLERLVGRGVEALPWAALPGAGAVANTSSAVLSGAGAQLAKEEGAPEWVGALIGALTPAATSGVVRGGKAMLGALGPSSLEQKAANAFKGATGLSDDAIKQAIAARPDDELGRLMTTAELTGNAGAAQIEKAAAAVGQPAEAYSALANQRANARELMLKGMSPVEAINPEALGSAMMSRADDVSRAMTKEEAKIWARVPRNVPIDVSRARAALDKVVKARQGGLDPGSKVKNLLGQVVEAKEPMTSGALQDIRSDALALSRDANLSPFEGRILTTLQKSIDGAMSKGLKGKDYNLWKAARDATSKRAETFARGTAGGSMTEVNARASQVLSNAFKGDKQSVIEMRAALRDDPLLFDQIKRGVLDKVKRVGATDELSPKKMGDFIKANEGGLRALFGEAHLRQMERIAQDLKSQARVQELANLASKGQSATAQKLSVAQQIGSMSIDKLEQMLGPVGQILRGARAKGAEVTQQGVNKILMRAALEPEYAALLVQKATPSNVNSVINGIASLAERGAFDLPRAGGSLEIPSLSQSQQRADMTSEQASAQRGLVGPTSSAQSGRAEMQDREAPEGARLQGIPSPNSTTNSAPRAQNQQQGEVTKQNVAALVQKQHPLVQAVISVESDGDPRAVSKKGAQGLMQLMPANSKKFAILDPFDPMENIAGGVRLLQEEMGRFKDTRLGLAAYNAGSPAVFSAIRRAQSKSWVDVQKYLPKETRDYVKKVMAKHTELVRV